MSKEVEAYRISRKAVNRLEESEKLEKSTVAMLRGMENTVSTSTVKFEELLKRSIPGIKTAELAEIKKVCNDSWSVPSLNSIDFGEFIFLAEGVRIRRVIGGWNYEYVKKSTDGKEEVTAAVFVGTMKMKTP